MSGQQQPNLTEGQMLCLRLVSSQLTSKEIARQLGISPFTVDQRLDAARKKLNAGSRKEAARIFARTDGSVYQRIVYEPDRFAIRPDGLSQIEPTNQVEQAEAAERHFEHSFGREFVSDQNGFSKQIWSFLSVPPIGGQRHNLPKHRIILHSLNIAFFSTIIIAMILVILAGTMRMIS